MEYLIEDEKVKTLKVVNDTAEMGITLMTLFNRTLTNQEEPQQYFLKVIEKQRDDFHKFNQTTLLQI